MPRRGPGQTQTQKLAEDWLRVSPYRAKEFRSGSGVTVTTLDSNGFAAVKEFTPYLFASLLGKLIPAFAGTTTTTLVRAGTRAAPLTAEELAFAERYLAGSGGRWGSGATRALNHQLASQLRQQGFKLQGGGFASEEWIAGPGGGTKGGTWVDITATRGTQTVRIQTVTTLADGVTPTAAEQAAADRIRAAFPNDELILIPK